MNEYRIVAWIDGVLYAVKPIVTLRTRITPECRIYHSRDASKITVFNRGA